MTKRKERLTVTVDPNLLVAAREAVSAGRAESVSAWVSSALAERAAKERRLSALAEAIAIYEEDFGEISENEVIAQARADRTSAVIVRGPARRARGKRRRRGVA
jgi:hypothetical protein